ncbi:uncharacterized protein [Periplaneta americana]|uniref:uncharacterized protein isoform X1 n=1 Tax=Periplaneta americana TaxID=6978 RepID=UPI0037E9607B
MSTTFGVMLMLTFMSAALASPSEAPALSIPFPIKAVPCDGGIFGEDLTYALANARKSNNTTITGDMESFIDNSVPSEWLLYKGEIDLGMDKINLESLGDIRQIIIDLNLKISNKSFCMRIALEETFF